MTSTSTRKAARQVESPVVDPPTPGEALLAALDPDLIRTAWVLDGKGIAQACVYVSGRSATGLQIGFVNRFLPASRIEVIFFAAPLPYGSTSWRVEQQVTCVQVSDGDQNGAVVWRETEVWPLKSRYTNPASAAAARRRAATQANGSDYTWDGCHDHETRWAT